MGCEEVAEGSTGEVCLVKRMRRDLKDTKSCVTNRDRRRYPAHTVRSIRVVEMVTQGPRLISLFPKSTSLGLFADVLATSSQDSVTPVSSSSAYLGFPDLI